MGLPRMKISLPWAGDREEPRRLAPPTSLGRAFQRTTPRAPSRAALCVWFLIRYILVPIQCLRFYSAGSGSCAWLDGAMEPGTYPVQGVQPAAVSEEALQQSQWPFR